MKNLTIIILFSCLILPAQAQEKFIKTSDGVNLYVNVRGQGIPCLYIHGGPGSGSHWLEKFSGEMLEKHFKMIYLDQRGVSRSTSPADGNYSMDRMVKDFEEVRAALGIDKWITFGHSFGGILQMGYAERHPEVLEGMIMICCGLDLTGALNEVVPKACEILGITDLKPYTDMSIPASERMKNIQGLYGQLREKDLFWKMGYADKKNIEIMNASFDDIPQWNKDFENAAMSNDEYMKNFKDETAMMKMPVLFFYGNRDYMVGPGHHIGIKFPEILFWESNTGHVPFLENKPDLEKAITSYQDKFDLN